MLRESANAALELTEMRNGLCVLLHPRLERTLGAEGQHVDALLPTHFLGESAEVFHSWAGTVGIEHLEDRVGRSEHPIEVVLADHEPSHAHNSLPDRQAKARIFLHLLSAPDGDKSRLDGIVVERRVAVEDRAGDSLLEQPPVPNTHASQLLEAVLGQARVQAEVGSSV